MIVLQIIITLLVFLILLAADMKDWRLSSGLLFIFYMFGLIAFDISDKQAIFYALGIIFFMATKNAMEKQLQTNANNVNAKDFGGKGLITGFKYHILSVFIGIVMIFIMFFIAKSKGQFLGVASLSVTTGGVTTWLTMQFAPALSLALGFIENRMFIAILNLLDLARHVLSLIPILGVFFIVLPFVLTCFTFGIFHITSYHLSWSLMIWAALIMAMWIGSYFLLGRDTTAMDTAHGGWNGLLTTKETLSIIT